MSVHPEPRKHTTTLTTLDPALKSGGRLKFESRVTILAILAGLPAVSLCALLLWLDGYSARTQWTIDLLLVFTWLGIAVNLKQRIVRPLQTLSNILAAIREGDFSIRGRRAGSGDALGEVMIEVNELGQTLREQRLGAMEATALLRTVMAEIDVAVFAFDGDRRLRLVNRAGERLLSQPSPRLLGRTSSELGLEACLAREFDGPQTMQMVFPGGVGRWDIRRSTFRERGVSHQLLVLTDLSQTLREEERTAWQRLLRVLGHELNNSLAPIKSVAGSLADLLERQPEPADYREDMQRGLDVISSRASSLARFVESYSKLARLPQPRFETLNVGELVRRVASLETRLPVSVVAGPEEVMVQGDSAQLEQLLINLVRNAVDASLETGGAVKSGWTQNNGKLDVWVTDEGLGLASTANLFVPFFTTKVEGSGIGLVLSRQIAEAHGGTLTLENRNGLRGCEARLRLPM